jgi:hypothetical protein
MRLEVDINLEARVKGEITNALHMLGNTCPFQAELMLKATAALWLWRTPCRTREQWPRCGLTLAKERESVAITINKTKNHHNHHHHHHHQQQQRSKCRGSSCQKNTWDA